jgi:hypothetical protein
MGLPFIGAGALWGIAENFGPQLHMNGSRGPSSILVRHRRERQ